MALMPTASSAHAVRRHRSRQRGLDLDLRPSAWSPRQRIIVSLSGRPDPRRRLYVRVPQLARLAAARETGKGQRMGDAIFVCYQVPVNDLPIRRRHALAAFAEGFISIGKLAESFGMHVLDLQRWLSEHGIDQNTAMSADDHLNA